MESCAVPQGEYDIPIYGGMVFTVRPLTSLDMKICQAKAAKIMRDLRAGLDVCDAFGFVSLPDNLDMDDPEHMEALEEDLLTKIIGTRHIKSWTNVENFDTGEPLPVTDKYVRAVLKDPVVAEIFYRKITMYESAVRAAKKESRTAAAGTPATVRNTAAAAGKPTSHAPAESAA